MSLCKKRYAGRFMQLLCCVQHELCTSSCAQIMSVGTYSGTSMIRSYADAPTTTTGTSLGGRPESNVPCPIHLATAANLVQRQDADSWHHARGDHTQATVANTRRDRAHQPQFTSSRSPPSAHQLPPATQSCPDTRFKSSMAITIHYRAALPGLQPPRPLSSLLSQRDGSILDLQ